MKRKLKREEFRPSIFVEQGNRTQNKKLPPIKEKNDKLAKRKEVSESSKAEQGKKKICESKRDIAKTSARTLMKKYRGKGTKL